MYDAKQKPGYAGATLGRYDNTPYSGNFRYADGFSGPAGEYAPRKCGMC